MKNQGVMRAIWTLPFLALLLFPHLSMAEQGPRLPHQSEDERDGYLWDIQGERDIVTHTLNLVQKPKNLERDRLAEALNNRQLNKEFKENYQARFGYTEAGQISDPSARTFRSNASDFRIEESKLALARQREFGEYVVRRVVEHQVDDYFKSEPSLRKVYELKERISSVSVEVKPGYKFDSRYHYSGNYITLDFFSPLLNSQVRFEMNPSSVGPGEIQETVFSVSKGFTPTFSMETFYKIRDQVFTVVGRKWLTSAICTSVSATQDRAALGRKPAENIILAGLSILY